MADLVLLPCLCRLCPVSLLAGYSFRVEKRVDPITSHPCVAPWIQAGIGSRCFTYKQMWSITQYYSYKQMWSITQGIIQQLPFSLCIVVSLKSVSTSVWLCHAVSSLYRLVSQYFYHIVFALFNVYVHFSCQWHVILLFHLVFAIVPHCVIIGIVY